MVIGQVGEVHFILDSFFCQPIQFHVYLLLQPMYLVHYPNKRFVVGELLFGNILLDEVQMTLHF